MRLCLQTTWKQRTDRWCEEILKGAPLSIRASKEAALRGLEETRLADAMKNQNDYPAYAQWRTSEDLKEGRAAFAEKRAPVMEREIDIGTFCADTARAYCE